MAIGKKLSPFYNVLGFHFFFLQESYNESIRNVSQQSKEGSGA
jgi:hypothetical protein